MKKETQPMRSDWGPRPQPDTPVPSGIQRAQSAADAHGARA
jgi:hypothetical protein